MDIHSLVVRSRQIRAEIDEMEKLSAHDRMLIVTGTLTKAKELLLQMEYFCQGTDHQYTWLLQQVWDICGVLTRDSSGIPWKRDLPDKAAASEFYQKILALVRWLKTMK